MAKNNPKNAPAPKGPSKAPKKVVLKKGRPRLEPEARKDKRVSSDPDYRKKVREGKQKPMSQVLEESKPGLTFEQTSMGGINQLMEPQEKFDEGLNHTHIWAKFHELDFSAPNSARNTKNQPVDPNSRAGANYVGAAVRAIRSKAENLGFPTKVFATPNNIHTIYVRGRCRACDGGQKRPLKPLL